MIPSILALALCLPGAQGADPLTDLTGALADADITAHQVIEVSPAQQRAGVMLVPFVMDGERYTLELVPHSVRSGALRVRIDTGEGALIDVTPPAPATYIGTLLERPGTSASASIVDGRVQAIVRFPDESAWTLQPAADFAPGAEGHILYTARDLAARDHACETVTLDGADDKPEFTDAATITRGGTIYNAELAWDVDWGAYQELGSSVANCIAEVERITNDVNTVYERDVSITHTITDIIVRTTAASDPYTSSVTTTFLGQVSDEWNMAPLNAVDRDLLHVLTGRDIVNTEGNTNTIGVAYIGTACSQGAGIGISENRTSQLQEAGLVAHELGHNWDARHCNGDPDCRIMCSGLGGCDGLNPLQFEASAIASIIAERDNANCLDETMPTSCDADFDADGDVDLTDFGTFGAAFGSMTGDANYNSAADFDNDGDVDLTDFGTFGSEFGNTGC